MGQLLVIVPLPWTAVFIHSVFLLSSVASALSLLGLWAFLPPLSVSLLSDVVVPFLEETGRSSRRFYVFQSSTWWSSV